LRKYGNIRAELARDGLHLEDLARELGISTTTLSYKLNGKKRWWLHEAKQIVDFLNSRGRNYTIDELFEL